MGRHLLWTLYGLVGGIWGMKQGTLKSYRATCPPGLEVVLERELLDIGATDVSKRGFGCSFQGDDIVGYKAGKCGVRSIFVRT